MNLNPFAPLRRILVNLSLFLSLGAVMPVATARTQTSYDPLAKTMTSGVGTEYLELFDGERDRKVPIKVYFPKSETICPVIVFSHGLGGSREAATFMGEHWATRGYIAVFLQHPGSDESVWKGQRLTQRKAMLQQNASFDNLVLRCDDVRFALDQMSRWTDDSKLPFAGRLDLDHIGMCGHSFGAHTSQAVGGQTFPLIGKKYRDDRLKAVIAFSPSSPTRGKAEDAFGRVDIPWMLMTGTDDVAAIGGQTVESCLAVFPALPKSIERYEIVLKDAPHSVFSDSLRATAQSKSNPNHHRVILALSTAFWDAYLREDSEAKAWLQGTGPNQIKESADRWQWAGK